MTFLEILKSRFTIRAVEQILKAFSRLLLQSSACQAFIAGRWVVTLSTPCHRSSAAG